MIPFCYYNNAFMGWSSTGRRGERTFEGAWRKCLIRNCIFCTLNLLEQLSRRMGWMGHAARMGEINTYRSFCRKVNMKETAHFEL
jgi:hypothetical protein